MVGSGGEVRKYHNIILAKRKLRAIFLAFVFFVVLMVNCVREEGSYRG